MTSRIKCCKNCVPPKRYPGCGAKCEAYIAEKKALAAQKVEKDKIDKPYKETYEMHKRAVSKAMRRRGDKGGY